MLNLPAPLTRMFARWSTPVPATPTAESAQALPVKAERPETSDFMQTVANSILSLAEGLAKRGYILSFTMGSPSLMEVSGDGRAFLQCPGKIQTQNGDNLASFTVWEKQRNTFSPIKGPNVFLCFEQEYIGKSAFDETYMPYYALQNPADHMSWNRHATKEKLIDDLVKALDFLKFVPKLENLTDFRGFKITPIL